MRMSSSLSLLAASLLVASPAAAQHDGHAGMEHPSVVADLLADVEQVRDKLTQLAEAMPESAWEWRPGEGVRSVGEVFLHVTADNYLLPTALGTAAPAETGIVGDDYATVQAFEGRELGKAETIAGMQASFDHLVASMGGVDDAALTAPVKIFGMDFTGQSFLVLTTTHLHEHLGQMIAYARTNDVVPPWSGGGD
jgi:uncharacterized damage-inducible protein DinB